MTYPLIVLNMESEPLVVVIIIMNYLEQSHRGIRNKRNLISYDHANEISLVLRLFLITSSFAYWPTVST